MVGEKCPDRDFCRAEWGVNDDGVAWGDCVEPEIQNGFAVAGWMPVVAAFAFGLSTGWLIWGGRKKAASAAERVRARAAEMRTEPILESEAGDAPADLAEKLAAIEAEIAAARAAAAEDADDPADLAADLSRLEEAIARANGRLKLLSETKLLKAAE